MLKYNKLFLLLEHNGINKSSLRNMGFSPNLIVNLSKGENINTRNINKLCTILNCQPGDIMEYIPDEDADNTNTDNTDTNKNGVEP